MKTRNVLAVIVFMAAIGSAFASSLFAVNAFTRKIDVPAQAPTNCVLRTTCPNTGLSNCQITIDHDGDATTDPITVNLFDGSVQTATSCGIVLKRP